MQARMNEWPSRLKKKKSYIAIPASIQTNIVRNHTTFPLQNQTKGEQEKIS